MARRRADSVVAPDHLSVAKPLRPEDLDRRVTQHGIYPSLPTSPGVPWSAYVRSQRMGSRSVSSCTEALDSDQARHITQRIIQHTRSLPTNSPVPYAPSTDREYRAESGLSDRYTSRAPIATGVHRSSYDGYVTEHDDYATLGGITPAPSSTEIIVHPRIGAGNNINLWIPQTKRHYECRKSCVFQLTSYIWRKCYSIYRHD